MITSPRRHTRRYRVFCRNLALTTLAFFLAGLLQAAAGHAALASLSFLACACCSVQLVSFLRRPPRRAVRVIRVW
jgi:hypothetical protein